MQVWGLGWEKASWTCSYHFGEQAHKALVASWAPFWQHHPAGFAGEVRRQWIQVLYLGPLQNPLEDQPPTQWSWVQLTKNFRTEPELQLLFCHRPQATTSQENLTTASTHHGRAVTNYLSAVSEAWLFLLLPQLEQFQSLSSTPRVTLLRSQGQWAALHSPRSTGQPAALSWEGSSGHGRDFATTLRHPASRSAEGQL